MVKSQLDLKGGRVARSTFDVPLSDDCFIRDCALLQNDHVAVINSQKQLVVQGKRDADMHEEMMNYYS